jgi:hypothetical protein
MVDSAAGTDSPDSEPLIAARKLAEAAKEMVGEMTKLATDASTKISDNTGGDAYGSKDLLRTAVKLVSAGILGGLRIAETALEVRPKKPNEGMLVMAEHLADVAQRTLAGVKGVAEETSKQVDEGGYTSAQAIRSFTKLADIAVVGGLESVETVVIGPAKYARPWFISDPYTASKDEANGKLVIEEDFKRPATAETIPRPRIRFDPPELRPGNNTFRMVVDEGGLPSGVYFGKVQVVGKDSTGQAVALDSIEVAIRL